MSQIVLVLLGALGGFAVHAIGMKVSFKQRTIDNKVYDALIATWVRMRNYIYLRASYRSAHGYRVHGLGPTVWPDVWHLAATSGEAILVCEDSGLTSDINDLNGRRP